MAERKYGVFGEFDIPRCKAKRMVDEVDDGKLQGFWKKVGKKKPGLPNASGCYIFGIRASKGATPWYVGQAKHQFREECFTDSKLLRYNKILAGGKKGTPILLLLARKTPNGRFKESLSDREANRLETLLIYSCLQANQELLNISGTSFFREAKIAGLLNEGARSSSAKFLRRLLNLK